MIRHNNTAPIEVPRLEHPNNFPPINIGMMASIQGQPIRVFGSGVVYHELIPIENDAKRKEAEEGIQKDFENWAQGYYFDPVLFDYGENCLKSINSLRKESDVLDHEYKRKHGKEIPLELHNENIGDILRGKTQVRYDIDDSIFYESIPQIAKSIIDKNPMELLCGLEKFYQYVSDSGLPKLFKDMLYGENFFSNKALFYSESGFQLAYRDNPFKAIIAPSDTFIKSNNETKPLLLFRDSTLQNHYEELILKQFQINIDALDHPLNQIYYGKIVPPLPFADVKAYLRMKINGIVLKDNKPLDKLFKNTQEAEQYFNSTWKTIKRNAENILPPVEYKNYFSKRCVPGQHKKVYSIPINILKQLMK